MNALMRTIRFIGFTLTEYIRSGRVLVEVLAMMLALYLFFRRWTSPMQPDYFFSTAGLLLLGLTFYTTSSIMSLGDRPQGYILLMRRLGRGGYLLGLYLAALVVELAVYGLLSLVIAFYNPVAGLTPLDWVLGSLPLALNLALLGALLTLLAPMVLTAGWRLLILAIVALAFSRNLIGGQTLADLWPPLTILLTNLQTIFSAPLLPAFAGFSLAVERNYSGVYVFVPLAQLFLTLSMLFLALYSFKHREITLSNG